LQKEEKRKGKVYGKAGEWVTGPGFIAERQSQHSESGANAGFHWERDEIESAIYPSTTSTGGGWWCWRSELGKSSEEIENGCWEKAAQPFVINLVEGL
jgi:hypothetical protein